MHCVFIFILSFKTDLYDAGLRAIHVLSFAIMEDMSDGIGVIYRSHRTSLYSRINSYSYSYFICIIFMTKLKSQNDDFAGHCPTEIILMYRLL